MASRMTLARNLFMQRALRQFPAGRRRRVGTRAVLEELLSQLDIISRHGVTEQIARTAPIATHVEH